MFSCCSTHCTTVALLISSYHPFNYAYQYCFVILFPHDCATHKELMVRLLRILMSRPLYGASVHSSFIPSSFPSSLSSFPSFFLFFRLSFFGGGGGGGPRGRRLCLASISLATPDITRYAAACVHMRSPCQWEVVGT